MTGIQFIKRKDSTTRDVVFFSREGSSGVNVGEAYPLDDGFYYYDGGSTSGVMSAFSMRTIADKLDEMNKEWSDQIDRDLKS